MVIKNSLKALQDNAAKTRAAYDELAARPGTPNELLDEAQDRMSEAAVILWEAETDRG